MKIDQYDRAVLQDVKASIVVPSASEAPIDGVLEAYPDIEQRTTLFYDERLRVLVVLDFPTCPEDQLQSLLSHLELRVDAWAVPAQQEGERSPSEGGKSSRELIATESVTNLDDPFTLVQQQEDETHGVRIQLVWETFLVLGRPRIRAHEISVLFVPAATISVNNETNKTDAYLEPLKPAEPNIFGAYADLPGMDLPFLPILTPDKVLSTPSQKEEKIRIKHQTSNSIRFYAAALPRLRYTKINTFQPEPATIASLDIEMIPVISVQGVIEKIDISLANGKVTSLMPDSLPMPCESKDSMTFLYDLKSPYQSDFTAPMGTALSPDFTVDILSIQVVIRLDFSPTSFATVTTMWTTNIDFSPILNSAYGAPAQNLQRVNRPNSLNFTSFADTTKPHAGSQHSSRTASTSLQHQMIPTTIPRQPLASVLSISFIASEVPIHIGQPFTWRVLIVNNSSKPAKLAIVPLPRIQRPASANQHFAKRHAPKASSSTIPLVPSYYAAPPATVTNTLAARHTRNAHSGSIARAIVEDHILYALHHQPPSTGATAVPFETDIVSLTAELRVGPLGIHQCHETELRFVAYKSGVFNIDAIRVVDLTSEGEAGVGVIHDIRELPEIVVLEDEQGEKESEDEDKD